MDSKTETVSDNRCAQCGWTDDNHRNGYCYHYSDEDTDYFYTDRKFISEKSLVGKNYSRAFDGRIIFNSQSLDTIKYRRDEHKIRRY